MKIQTFTFIGILYVLLQVWFFNISSLGWRLNASWVIITTILFTLIIIYANATINYYKDNGAKKMEQAIKDLIAEFEERLKEYRFNEQIYNGVDRVLHEYWAGMKIATYDALVELNKLLEV